MQRGIISASLTRSRMYAGSEAGISRNSADFRESQFQTIVQLGCRKTISSNRNLAAQCRACNASHIRGECRQGCRGISAAVVKIRNNSFVMPKSSPRLPGIRYGGEENILQS